MSIRIVSLLVAGTLLWAFAGVAQESAETVEPGTEVLRDKYILGLSKALKADDYPKALEFIGKLDELGVDLPPAIDYFRGEAYFHTKRYDEANRALNRYVTKTGREGRYYQQSLELMLVVEDRIEAGLLETEKARREWQQVIRRVREKEARQQRKEAQKWEKLGLVMVRVDGGSFTMGCQSGRDDAYDACYESEKPPHSVEVHSFEIGKYEVTQALWEAVMGYNPSDFAGCAMCPVEWVTWDEVQEFLIKLNAQADKRYRLPTEAEWEYAARGGQWSRGYQYAGGNELDSVAWHAGNSGSRTHPVGRKRANELGLHDMSGNVWEWVQDCWNGDYRGAPDDSRAWESEDCWQRTARGSSWAKPSPRWAVRSLRIAVRAGDVTHLRNNSLGFRITRTPPP